MGVPREREVLLGHVRLHALADAAREEDDADGVLLNGSRRHASHGAAHGASNGGGAAADGGEGPYGGSAGGERDAGHRF